ncbi:uncharacterized protein LOC109836928 isoform X2 [Asparagus officinalis]|uniref:uncharacterized protein LOC109836928 isoform X2 n=1 Tax=Asparagus officinalis TaxID=4686 RepID=UPI00098DEB83|nr:uncharacterized protein LOC109836928 isoform X2 [Asparagus officinalis]
MDFHTLARRDLQSLCKKNRIPANMTNVAMADALQALQTVEGVAEIQESLQFQSPKKLDLESPAPPRTGRRTTASRKVEQQGSPLPRSRRVTVKASEILDMVEDAESPKAPTTRSRAVKKQEIKVVAKTPATRRTTRQSSRKEVDDLMSGGLRRSTRVGGKGDSVKMASLAKDVEEEQNKEKETNDKVCEREQDLEVEVIKEAPISADQSEKTSKSLPEASGNNPKEEENQENNQEEALPGFDDSPVRGLISLDQDSSVQQSPVAEINTEVIEDLEKSSEENQEASDDQDFKLQELPISDENPASIEDSPDETQDLVASDLTDEIAKLSIGSIKDDGDLTAEAMESGDADEIDDLTVAVLANSDGIQDIAKSDLAAENSEAAIESSKDDDLTAETSAEAYDLTIQFPLKSDGIQPEILEGTIESIKVPTEADDLTFEILLNSDGTQDLAKSDLNAEISDDGLTIETTAEIADLTVEIPVEIDGSGNFTGDISVEAVGDLNRAAEKSAGKELPLAGIYKDDCNKENRDLTVLVVGPVKGGKQSYQSMSLRKLKAAYKETLVSINNKGEEKRTALGLMDENCI